MKFSAQTYQHLRSALKEDLGFGDKTSQLLIPSGAIGSAVIIAKSGGIFCGREVVRFLAKFQDTKLRVDFKIKDGESFGKGQILILLKGKLSSILAVERTALNFLAHLCGVATLTQRFVEKAKPFGVDILDTRKTTPLWRELEKHAVRTGGGCNHRMGLYDELFVKENHKTFKQLEKLKKFPHTFVIEVRNQKEIEEALALKPRVMLFDNFSIPDLKRAIQWVRKKDPKIKLEASGGINLANLLLYARTGIDQVSIGALTHSALPIDLSLIVRDF